MVTENDIRYEYKRNRKKIADIHVPRCNILYLKDEIAQPMSRHFFFRPFRS